MSNEHCLPLTVKPADNKIKTDKYENKIIILKDNDLTLKRLFKGPWEN